MKRLETPDQSDTLLAPRIQSLIEQSKHTQVELTDDILETVNKLDNCREFETELMNIVGVFANIKPVCFVTLYESDHEEEVLDLINDLGLYHAADGGNFGYIVSRYPELIEAAQDALARKWINDDTRQFAVDHGAEYEIGALLGYPTVATQNYLNRIEIRNETTCMPDIPALPKSFQYLKSFAQFVVSENPTEEIETYIKPLHDAVKIITPTLYNRITNPE